MKLAAKVLYANTLLGCAYQRLRDMKLGSLELAKNTLGRYVETQSVLLHPSSPCASTVHGRPILSGRWVKRNRLKHSELEVWCCMCGLDALMSWDYRIREAKSAWGEDVWEKCYGKNKYAPHNCSVCESCAQELHLQW